MPNSFQSVAITSASALTLIGFWVVDVFGHGGSSNPYLGIIFDLCLPALFVLGLLLIPLLLSLAGVDRLEKLSGWAEERGHDMLDLAFAWLLGHPVVSSVIAGATKPDQVAANAATASWKLTLAEVDEVTKLAA